MPWKDLVEVKEATGQPFPAGGLHRRHGRDRFLSRVRQQLLRLVREPGPSGESALAQLERAFYSHVSFIVKHPDVPRRILTWSLQTGDARLRRRVQKVVAHYEFRVSRVITRGQRQGSIRREVEPHAATRLFVGMLQSLVLHAPAERCTPETLLREADALFCAYVQLVRAGHA